EIRRARRGCTWVEICHRIAHECARSQRGCTLVDGTSGSSGRPGGGRGATPRSAGAARVRGGVERAAAPPSAGRARLRRGGRGGNDRGRDPGPTIPADRARWVAGTGCNVVAEEGLRLPRGWHLSHPD